MNRYIKRTLFDHGVTLIYLKNEKSHQYFKKTQVYNINLI